MKHYLRGVSWRFTDASATYPQINHRDLSIRSPEDVHRHFQFLFQDRVRERFVVIWLNTANRVSGFEILSEGTLNTSVVHPREVFRGAIVATCASIILAHNHPSGNPEPSPEDLQITRQIVDAGRIIAGKRPLNSRLQTDLRSTHIRHGVGGDRKENPH